MFLALVHSVYRKRHQTARLLNCIGTMTAVDIINWLDEESAEFPSRAGAEEFQRYIFRRLKPAAADCRDSLVEAMRTWISLRDETKTMLAVRIAVEYKLTELRGDVERLLVDIEAGRCFLPYYAETIRASLKHLAVER